MTLTQKLEALRTAFASRGPGWDKRYSDAVMQTVLDHHGFKWRKTDGYPGQHRVFASVAPHLFVDTMGARK